VLLGADYGIRRGDLTLASLHLSLENLRQPVALLHDALVPRLSVLLIEVTRRTKREEDTKRLM
jgi:hypothetical protein